MHTEYSWYAGFNSQVLFSLLVYLIFYFLLGLPYFIYPTMLNIFLDYIFLVLYQLFFLNKTFLFKFVASISIVMYSTVRINMSVLTPNMHLHNPYKNYICIWCKEYNKQPNNITIFLFLLPARKWSNVMWSVLVAFDVFCKLYQRWKLHIFSIALLILQFLIIHHFKPYPLPLPIYYGPAFAETPLPDCLTDFNCNKAKTLSFIE